MKYTIKTVLNNVIQNKEGQFTYNQKLVSMKWTESQERKKYTQSGTGPGEFGPDYSDRKKYQLGYGNESPSPVLKEFLVNTHRNPRESTYVPHVIEPYKTEETKMACDNIECNCEGCTCDPCTCTPDNLCGCADDHSNEWKGVV